MFIVYKITVNFPKMMSLAFFIENVKCYHNAIKL